jgi:hypothetical protein
VTEQPDKDLAPNAPFAYLDENNHQRLARVLCEHVPEVFRLNRVIEQRTGYSSEIGRNMLVDVLSHLGTLASRHDLTAAEQATQLSKIEEHLRRAIIEHPEEVVRNRIVDVRERWAEYQRVAFVYREEGMLRGVPRHQELEEMRERIDVLMESARSTKPDETSWEESVSAAASMTEAAHLTAELADKLEQCIGEAHRITRERERDATATRRERRSVALWIIGILVAIGLATGGGYMLGRNSQHSHEQPTSLTTVTSPQTRTSGR